MNTLQISHELITCMFFSMLQQSESADVWHNLLMFFLEINV